MMKTCLLSLLLITSSHFTSAQNIIKPGDKIIRYDWIKSSHDFYKNVVKDTSGHIIFEFMMDNVCTVDPVTKRITFIRNRQAPVGSFSADTSITDLTLKPISSYETLRKTVHHDAQFADELVTVKTTKNGVLTVKTYPMKSGYFEDNMIEYIFGYLELKKNITYTLDNFNKDAPKPSDPYTLTYLFDDTWTLAADHQLTCSVIRFTQGESSGYIWIDQSTHKTIKTIANYKGGSYVLTKR